MRYLLLLLSLWCLSACEPPQSFEDPLEMSKYPRNAPVPIHGVPVVSPLIPRIGGWTGDNQLGYEAKYGPDRRATQTILKLDEYGPPEVWTVSLFLKQKFTTFDGLGIVARINFGAGGSTQVYEMDWLNGAQVSLPMNSVNVQAIFRDVDVTTEGPGLSLGVQIARGRRGGNSPPRFTIAERIVVGAGAASEEILLPSFATAVYVQAITPTSVADVFNASSFLRLRRGNIGNASAVMLGPQLLAGQKLDVTGQAGSVQYSNGSGNGVVVNIVADLFG